MTSTEELIELSKRVAKKLGIEPQRVVYKDADDDWSDMLWLHEDSAQCFDLSCDRQFNIEHYPEYVHATAYPMTTRLDDFSNDRKLATRVAILRAIEGM